MNSLSLAEHTDRLDRLGVTINTGIRYGVIERDKVWFNTGTGKACNIPVNTVIIAGDPVADTSLFEQLKDHAAQVHAVGDCTGLGLIRKAVDDAMRVACTI